MILGTATKVDFAAFAEQILGAKLWPSQKVILLAHSKKED